MAVQYEQSNIAIDTNATATIGVTLDGNVTAGRCLVGAVAWACATADIPTLSGVSDDLSNTYVVDGTGGSVEMVLGGSTFRLQTFYAKNITGGSAGAITATLSAALTTSPRPSWCMKSPG